MNAWRRANFTDRLYLGYFVLLSALILLQRERVASWPSFLALHLVGIALIAALVQAADRFPTGHAWYPLMMPVLMFEEVARLNFLFLDTWQDRYLLQFEGWLFSEPPTVWFGRHANIVLTEILQAGYLSYYMMLFAVGLTLYRRKDKWPFFGLMAASAVSYLACYLVFLLFPTEGPAHTLRHQHTTPIPGGPLYTVVTFIQKAGVHGNAFPSAHVAGAMPPVLFAWRYAPRLAGWLTPLAVLLCVAAVYDRYHYASDVVAGIPIGVAAAGFWLLARSRPESSHQLNLVD